MFFCSFNSPNFPQFCLNCLWPAVVTRIVSIVNESTIRIVRENQTDMETESERDSDRESRGFHEWSECSRMKDDRVEVRFHPCWQLKIVWTIKVKSEREKMRYWTVKRVVQHHPTWNWIKNVWKSQEGEREWWFLRECTRMTAPPCHPRSQLL